MHYSNAGGYQRSALGRRWEKVGRKMHPKAFRALMWVGALTSIEWGYVAYHVGAFLVIVFAVLVVMAWLAALAAVTA